MKDFPHLVTVRLKRNEFRPFLKWLDEANHELRVTVKFGSNKHTTNDDFVTQEVSFKDANDAMLCKLTWGGSSID